jgi:hypothetical protein
MKPLFPALAAAFVAASMSGPAVAQTAEPVPMPSPQDSMQPGPMGSDQATPDGIDTGATGSIDLSVEQETQLRALVAQTAPVEVDFDVTVGAVVPADVTLTPIPEEALAIAPEYAEYAEHSYFVTADGSIAIVDPTSLEIVYVVDAAA